MVLPNQSRNQKVILGANVQSVGLDFEWGRPYEQVKCLKLEIRPPQLLELAC